MCGIAGICRLDGQPLNEDARAHVRAMTDVITYRGPDGSGIWQEGPVSLGHRRLSIIDLSGGSQPMQDVDGELCIVFNGEIYNFAELRQELLQAGARFHSSHSDTEVILQAYRVWGTDCLQRFDGMFAFALWDAPRRRLFCARDRFGKKPFFYTLQQGSLFFGSELNCLAAVPGLELTLDPQAVMRYLAYEYVPTPDTMYREAKSLPPSHWLLVEDGRLSIRRYWDLPPADEDDRRSEADICADVHELLTRAVGRRMVSDVPLGVFLSGGIDSSIVAGLMARQSSTPIKTFSIGFTEASYDESRYARVVAQRWNTDHHERVLSAEDCAEHLPNIISRMDVPMADASVAPTWLLSGVTREKVTVALGGDGADELWAGYEHYIAFKIAEWYNAIPGILRRGVIEPLTAESAGMEKLYDFELQQGGGHLTGWQLTAEQVANVADALAALCTPQAMEEKYGLRDAQPLLFAVGDGNHSLATAKACYENLKKVTPESEWKNLPARYALVEVVNNHDDALQFEPIHRVVFGADPETFMAEFKKAYPNVHEGKGEGHTIEVCWEGHDDFITVPDPKMQLAVGTLQSFLDEYLKAHGGEVDYIHGDEVTRELGGKPGNMGFLLPAMGKEQLFKTVMADGVLPRKTFSMGHAQDKRYYVEARKIK